MGKHVPIIPNYVQKKLSQCSWNDFKSIGITLRQFVWKYFDIAGWRFSESPLRCKCYIKAVIVLQPTQRASLYYFKRMYVMRFLPHLFCRHDSFTLQKICGCVDDTFLVPNESHDNHCRDSEKNLQFCTKRDLFSNRLDLFLIFLSTTAALNKLNYYQIFRDIENFMSLFGPSRIRQPPVLRK